MAVSPELAQVVVLGLAVRGARDAHRETRLQLPQLQQHNGQVMDEEQRIHQGHSVLHDALVVLVLEENGREEGRVESVAEMIAQYTSQIYKNIYI